MIPDGAKISDLTDRNGNVLLFRVIGQSFDPTHDKKGFWISYSLSPSITKKWDSSMMTGVNSSQWVVISQQNIHRDFLSAGQTAARGEPEFLKPGTTLPLRDDSGLQEVQLKSEQQEPIAVMTVEDFKKLTAKLGESYSIRSLVELLNSLPGTLK
jgi:hypothetical protein